MPDTANMKRLGTALCGLILVAGCAHRVDEQPAPVTVYHTTYQIGTWGVELPPEQAEAQHRQAANTRSLGADTLDAPIKLLRSPQPLMLPKDIDDGVSGRVVVRIVFDETGTVSQTQILESPSESLSNAVLLAVSNWAIAPATRAGKPTKVTVRQPFQFQTAR